MTQSLRPLFFALLQILFLAPTLAGMAHAHAVLQSSDPADNALLTEAPDQAHIRFNEAVAPLAIRLIAPDGSETDLTAQVPAGAQLAVPLPDLAEGTHVLSWRVASDDGHPVAGALVFSVGSLTGAAAAMPAGDPALRSAIWAARFLMTAGLVLAVGGALFGLIAPLSPAAQSRLRLAAVLGLVAAPAYLGLHGLDALGLGFAAIATPEPWAAAWSTSFGPAILMAMAAALLALLGLRWPILALPAIVLLGLSYATSGHAGAADPRWMTRPMVALHLAALTFWIGALIPLALSLRTGGPALARFSRFIPVAVIVLLGSGLALAIVQLGRDPDHWFTPYGYILAAKLALLALLFALAAWNRWALTGPAQEGSAPAQTAMRRSIMAELVLALVILGLAAAWRFAPPPRALAEAGPVLAAPAYGHLHSEKVMADLTVTPGSTGPVTVELLVTDGDMAPITPVDLTLALWLPERGIERMTRTATPVEGQPGLWQITDLVLPLAGTWSLQLDVRLSRFDLVKLGGEIDIK